MSSTDRIRLTGAYRYRQLVNLFAPLTENALRQTIDSFAVFEEFQRVKTESSACAGGMYWKVQGAYEYLVRTFPDGRQQRIGPRSPETELAFKAFALTKTRAQARLRKLRTAIKEAERLNKALRVGQVPSSVIAFLNGIEDSDIFERCTVIGACALHAFEMRAGVRMSKGVFHAPDLDAPSTMRNNIQLLMDVSSQRCPLLQSLLRVDKSFRLKRKRSNVAVNAADFEVECFRSETANGIEYSSGRSGSNVDVRPVVLRHADVLVAAPVLEQTVVASTGRMATMKTVSPEAFVEFATLMSGTESVQRLEGRQLDLVQLQAVQKLIDERWL